MSLVLDKHMKLALWSLLFIGISHVQFAQEKWAQAHKIYQYFVIVYFIAFVCTEIIDIPIVYAANDFDALMNNLAVTLLYISSVVKFYVMLRKDVAALVQYVREIEFDILRSSDEDVIKIFNQFRVYNNRLSALILYIGVFTIFIWFINPGLTYIDWLYSEKSINSTYQRSYIFGSWFFFDKTKHYWIAYAFHVVDGSYGAAITVIPDAVLWSFMTFALMQLSILKYKLQNIPKHVKETRIASSWLTAHQAQRIVVNECFYLHKNIISFVKSMDDAMNGLMFVDFCICSLQIGTCCMRVLFNNGEKFMMFSSLEYLCGIFVQLMLFYWHANEILIESLNVSTAISHSQWYDCEEDIKKDLQFMMLRSQKPLLLNIGPFYYMSTSTVISIMKATYSYIALMRQFYA